MNIHLFYGSTSPFSNFHPSVFVWNQISFCCVEQAMQYAKAMTFQDTKTAEQILATKNPVRHKQLGRRVKPFDPVIWGSMSTEVVYEACLAKFSQNEHLKNSLLHTGDAILGEASPRDALWGIGLSVDDDRANDPSRWVGKNKLGHVLMRVREQIKAPN